MIGYYLKWTIPFLITAYKQHGNFTTPAVPVPTTPDALPAGVREAFDEVGARLRGQGFQHSAVQAMSMNGNPAAAHVLHLVSPEAGDHAIVYRFGEHAWITFVRAYAGGGHVVTSNIKQPGVFTPPPQVSIIRSAATDDAVQLHALHRAHAEEKERGGRLGAPVAATPDPGFVEAWERLTMDRQVDAGNYTPDGDGYRMTLRGSLLMTRRSLPHAREQRDRADAQAAAALAPRAVTT